MRIVAIDRGILGAAHAIEAIKRGRTVTQLEREPEARGATVRDFGLFWVSGRTLMNSAQARAIHGGGVSTRDEHGARHDADPLGL